jgi:small subunit ribosomal protein S6
MAPFVRRLSAPHGRLERNPAAWWAAHPEKELQLREIQQRVRQYELMAVFSPDLTEEDLPGAIERVSGYITTAGGEVISTNHESPWGRRRLAYAIRYQWRDVRDGYYVLYYFDIQSTQIAEIEREIGLNDRLIRHIITIRGEIPAAPQPEEGAEGQPEVAAEPAPVAAAPADEATEQTEAAASEPEVAPAEEAPAAEPVAEAEASESVEPEAEAEPTES